MKRFVTTLTAAIIVATSAAATPEVGDVVRASWYGPGLQGNKMANGDRFDMNDPTVVAHKSLPFGTCVVLENIKNSRRIAVEVQDRGPYIHDREFDLSKAAAKKLGYTSSGVARLEIVEINRKGCKSS